MLTKHLKEIAAYKKDTDATRYTFGIWDFVNKTGESLGYYATLSVNRTDTDPNTHVGNDVYFRIVKKSDGSDDFLSNLLCKCHWGHAVPTT